MKLQPYLCVDSIPFSLTLDAALAQWGRPRHSRRNAVQLTELDYGDLVLRFQDCGRLEEVTRRAPVLYLIGEEGAADVPFAGLAAFVRTRDAGAFERAGFFVSPRYGLAFVPDAPDWVTALAPHCIQTWRGM